MLGLDYRLQPFQGVHVRVCVFIPLFTGANLPKRDLGANPSKFHTQLLVSGTYIH